MSTESGEPALPLRRFARHVSTLGGGRVAAAFVSAAWMVVAARLLTTSEFGDLAVLLAVGAVVIVIGDLGYPFLLADAVSRSGQLSAATLAGVGRRRVVVGLVAAVVGSGLYLAVGSDRSPVIPLLFGVSLIATVVHSSVAAGLRGLGSFGPEAFSDVASRIGVLFVGWLVLASGGGVAGAVAVYAAADVLSLVGLTVVARRHLSPSDGIDLSLLSIRRTWPLSTGRLLAALYNRGDTWLLAALRSPADAGLYAAPYRVLDGLVLIPRAAGAVAVTHAGESLRLGRGFWAPRRIALVAAAAMTVVVTPLILAAEPIVLAVFGEDFREAGPVFAVLAASAVPGSIVAVLAPLGGVRRGRPFAGIMGVVVVVNLTANLIVIPIAGPIGAAWVTLGVQLALAAIMLVLFGGAAVMGAPTRAASEPPRDS
jgi:O-antigen/teichoic acid export membrane protein